MALDGFSAKKHDGEARLVPARTAVLVIDMLNDFCKPGGKMVLPDCERLIAPQRAVMAAARATGGIVVFVCDAHRVGLRHDREFAKRAEHCIEGTWGAGVIDELAPAEDDLLVTKRRYSGFFNSDLDLTLKDMQIETVIAMGVVTNICVRSTVHDAFFLGYQAIVPEDCVAATGPREQLSSLYDIATHFGIVSGADEIVAALRGGAALVNRIAA